MAPEASSSLVVLDLAEQDGRVVGIVDRLDSRGAGSELSILWDAQECPTGFEPIGAGEAVYVHIPAGYLRSTYRAGPDRVGAQGLAWPDRIVGSDGLTLVILLPPGWGLKSADAAAPLFASAKVVDGRLVLLWTWRPSVGGAVESVRATWSMARIEVTDEHVALLNEQASRAMQAEQPVITPWAHVDRAELARLALQEPAPPMASAEPPEWHRHQAALAQSAPAASRTAVILTAIPVEYKAVAHHLADLREDAHPQGTIYERGTFDAGTSSWHVGLVEIGAGNEGAAQEAERAIAHFSPQVVLFVGVAGGIKDVALGDVVAATKVYSYQSGKAAREFLTRPEVGKSSYQLVQRARSEARKNDWLKRLTLSGGDPPPRAFVEPIAAGEQVVASPRSETFRFLRSAYGDAIAVEMEGSGFLRAAYANPNVQALVVRGISDLIANKGRSDAAGWQARAAEHASAFAFQVLAMLGPTGATRRRANPRRRPPRSVRAEPTTPRAPGVDTPPIGALIDALLGSDPLPGNAAVHELIRRGPSGVSDELIVQLGSRSMTEQASARLARVLGAFGAPSAERLLTLIREGSWSAKQAAAAGFSPALRAFSETPLEQLIHTANMDVARCAIDALGNLGEAGWAWHIVDASTRNGDEFQKLAHSATRALSKLLGSASNELQADAVLHAMRRFLGRADELGSASETLEEFYPTLMAAALHPTVADAAIARLLRADDAKVRRLALYIVGATRLSRTLPALGNVLRTDPDEDVRKQAAWSIRCVGGEAAATLLERAWRETTDERLRSTVQRALSDVFFWLPANTDAEHVLTDLLNADSYARAGGVYAASAWPERLPLVVDALADEDAIVRGSAAVAYARMAGRAAVDRLTRAERESSELRERLLALSALVRIGRLERIGVLRDALGEADRYGLSWPLVRPFMVRELMYALAQDPTHGSELLEAWAAIMRTSAADGFWSARADGAHGPA